MDTRVTGSPNDAFSCLVERKSDVIDSMRYFAPLVKQKPCTDFQVKKIRKPASILR